MLDLGKLRDEIDVIDSEIVRLFEDRMKICAQVAEYKITTGKQVFDREREVSKIKTLKGKAHSSFNATGIEELFQQVMSMSRKLQYQLLTEHGIEEEKAYTIVDKLPMEDVKVVFQGVEGAYSYAAMEAYFGKGITSFHVKTWRDAMNAIVAGKADYAVLPIENSTAGIVADIYDLLVEYDLHIVGEQIIRCEHALLGVPGAKVEQIETVYSHPQALAQCKMYLEAHPRIKKRELENTAVAAKKVSEEGNPTGAAIASKSAAQFYGLEVLADNIYHNAENSTRFIIVSKHQCYEKDTGKISICFELPHASGTLYNMLSHIIYNGLNMSKIESRPITGKNWEYRFFIDFEGNLQDSAVKNALRGIQQEAKGLRVFGNY